MKKIFTLVAGALLICSGVSAQKKWTDKVVNGKMEGEMPAYTTLEEMQTGGVLNEGATWNSFWSHEFPLNEIGEEQYQGTATIVEDALIPGNHCARVIARSEAIADSCENKTAADGKLASWDCQFFIFATEPIAQGKLVRLTMKVRADKAGKAETQAHWTPGDYNHYQLFGNVDVTTEWQTFVSDEVIVSADQCKEGDGKFFQSVAFNLSTDVEGNVFYFDDIKLEVKDDNPGGGGESGAWINFIRKGINSEDKIGDFTTFTGRNGATNKDEKAEIVNDPLDGQPALKVSTIAWNEFKALTDSLGNDSLDSEGNVVYDKFYVVDGDTILGTGYGSFDDWRTQFFVAVKHKFKTGQKYRFKMSARATAPVTLDTQVHTTPGAYIHWSFVGSLDLTEDWQDFEFGYDEENPSTIAQEANGGQTIAFNCNKNKDTAVDIYFRFEELSFEEGVVTDNERVLDSAPITLPVPANGEDDVQGEIDLNSALSILEADFGDFTEGKNVKIKSVKVEQEEGEDPEEIEYFKDVDLSAGAPLDARGFAKDGYDDAIILELDDDSSDGKLLLNISNSGVTMEEGKSIETQFVFEKNFWRYLFNVSFVDAKDYAGVNEVKTSDAKANTLYDLMGRQLTKAAKGLYIMNGKKVLVK
jgi:hypothetical protein